jgi:hypothetical protein
MDGMDRSTIHPVNAVGSAQQTGQRIAHEANTGSPANLARTPQRTGHQVGALAAVHSAPTTITLSAVRNALSCDDANRHRHQHTRSQRTHRISAFFKHKNYSATALAGLFSPRNDISVTLK